MSDKDDIIRNPNRNNKPEYQAYEPEWVRLGKQPIQMPRKTVPLVKSSKKIDNPDFSSVDGRIFDDNGNEITVEQGHIIDNNDYVFPPPNIVAKVIPAEEENTTQEEQSVQGQPKVGEYILLVSGKIVHTGSIQQVESIARTILYGENESFQEEVKVDDIVVLKRVGINVGIFIDRQ
jgi:hypothetical protein